MLNGIIRINDFDLLISGDLDVELKITHNLIDYSLDSITFHI